MTNALNSMLHAELGKAGLMAQKETLVSSFTNHRTTSSREMNDAEARELIQHLKSLQGRATDHSANTMRRKILSICHQLGWYVRVGSDDASRLVIVDGKPVLDYNRINQFCIERTPEHKKLNDFSITELPNLVTIFQRLLKSHLNHA